MLSKNIINTIDLNSRDENGNTILQQAVLNDNIETVSLILNKLENSADKDMIINAQNNNGDTAFFLAVMNKKDIISQMLDAAGADKTIKNNDGKYIIVTEEDKSDNNIIIEDSEIVDFKFPVVKCSNNSDDITEIMFAIKNINPIKNLIDPTNNETLTENNDNNNIDQYLNSLTDQYLILKNIKQAGGYNKQTNKIIYGSRII